jgi:mono/diheme cytochrome c family protein
MNQSVQRFATSGLGPFLLALLLVELTVIGATPPQRHRTRVRSGNADRVGDLFRSNCARCHGGDGRGDTPLGHTYNAPDFTDAEWWRKHVNITGTPSLISIVSHGRAGMPAFGKKLKRSEIRLLVNYVRKFRKQQQ